jgi:hypothetical protein
MKNKLIKTTLLVATTFTLTYGILSYPTDYTYAVASNGNAKHYEYYTDALCKVVEVAEDKTSVTVRYKGNDYTFETDGCTDCTVGSKWIVTFNSQMEIVDVK